MNSTRKVHYCPNCQAVWTEEEVFAQACNACDFPDNDTDSDLDIWEEEN